MYRLRREPETDRLVFRLVGRLVAFCRYLNGSNECASIYCITTTYYVGISAVSFVLIKADTVQLKEKKGTSFKFN